MNLAALNFLVGFACTEGFIFKIMHFSQGSCKFDDITRVDSGYTESCYFDTTQNTKITIEGDLFVINAYSLNDTTCTGTPVANARKFKSNTCNNRIDGTSFRFQQLISAKLNIVDVYSDAACATKVTTTFLPFNICKFPLDGKFTSTICQGSDINTYTWETNTCGGASTKAWSFKVGECVQFPGDATNYYKATRCGNAFDTNVAAEELPYVTPPMMPPKISPADPSRENSSVCCPPGPGTASGAPLGSAAPGALVAALAAAAAARV